LSTDEKCEDSRNGHVVLGVRLLSNKGVLILSIEVCSFRFEGEKREESQLLSSLVVWFVSVRRLG